MTNEKPPLRPWQLPLTEKQKAENLKHIRERHALLLDVGPDVFRTLNKPSVRFRIETDD